MAKIELRLSHNPYRYVTSLVALTDGMEVICGETSFLEPVYSGGFYRWLEPHDTWPGFFAAVSEAFDTNAFLLTFAGTESDRELLEKTAVYWEARLGLSVELRYIPRFARDYYHDFLEFYYRILDGTLSEFQEQKIRDAFVKLLNNRLEICITAPISSGKSTLVNALIGRSLLPTSVLAKTAVPAEVSLHPDSRECILASLRNDGRWETWDEPVTQELVERLNDETDPKDSKVALRQRIHLETPVYRSDEEECRYFLDNPMELVFTDTPGDNNAWNIHHENTTARVLEEDSWELLLFVFSADSIEYKDTFAALHSVLKRIKARGNWETEQNRLLFVCNHADKLSAPYGEIQQKLRRILRDFGIRDPQVYLTSAYAAELIRAERYSWLPEADPADQLTQEREDDWMSFVDRLSSKALPKKQNVLYRLRMKKSNPDKALYHFSSLPKHVQAEFDEAVTRIREGSPDEPGWPEVALLHSGVPALEYAIWTHCTQLAFPMKLRQFQAVMLPMLTDILLRTQRRMEDILRQLEEVEQAICKNERQLRASGEVLRWIRNILGQSEDNFVFDGGTPVHTLKDQLQACIHTQWDLIQALKPHVKKEFLSGWISGGLWEPVYQFADRLIGQMAEKADNANRILKPWHMSDLARDYLRSCDIPRFRCFISRNQLLSALLEACAVHSDTLDETGLIDGICAVLTRAAEDQREIDQEQYYTLRNTLKSREQYARDWHDRFLKERRILDEKAEEIKKERERCAGELEATYKLLALIREFQTE